LSIRHTAAADIYGWLATIVTFGFVTAYLLVVMAALVRLRRCSGLASMVWFLDAPKDA
jgi:hypothetical protein